MNIKQLAQELNLSVSTVSRALSDSYEISAKTKEKVLEMAKKLDFQPNPHASSLRKQKSKTIAVVIPEIANNFFSLAINGIETVAQAFGYHVLIYLTHDEYEKEVAIAEHLLSGRVDGILVSMASETNNISHLQKLNEKNKPIVFFDRVSELMNTPKVTTDDFNSSFLATEHLIKKSCKRIAFLNVSEHLSIGRKRLEGYLAAVEKHGIDKDPELVINDGRNSDEAYEKIKEILLYKKRPDGVFASVEKLAIATYHICNELNFSIPNDLKVISFSNLETASLLNPSLTTITQPAFEIGKEAATVLFKGLDRGAASLEEREIVLNSKLIERESTK